MSWDEVPPRLRPLLAVLEGEPVAAVVGGQVVRGVIVAPADAGALLDYLRSLLERDEPYATTGVLE